MKKEEITVAIPKNPLGRIAICMSGGGYRAAVFQLGLLSYLHRLKLGEKNLLENVKAISTVSGGTFTGVTYASQLRQGKSFKEIYVGLIDWLLKTDLVKLGLTKVSNDGEWKYQYKNRNLINAFAELYDSTLTKGAQLGLFENLEEATHLEFVCFNSTEFNTGRRFRFQMAKGQNYVGSGGTNIKYDIYSLTRLSDVIAASSAFSGGFEPISMPNDFFDLTEEQIKYFKEHSGYEGLPIGLMDGGIYDNQGISAILDYQDNKGIEDFDLVLISDVSSPYMDAFRFSKENQGDGREKTINDWKDSLIIWCEYIFAGILTMTLFGFVLVIASGLQGSTALGIGISISVFGLLLFALFDLVRRRYDKLKNKIETTLKKVIEPFYFKRLKSLNIGDIKLKRLETLILDRLNSLKLLLPTIFLKQIRRLHYDRIYEEDAYVYRRLSCLVKELTPIDFDKKKEDDYDIVKERLVEFSGETYEDIIGENLKEYVEAAARFGTTLWFTESNKLEEVLESLLVSGQSTCCQNLLIYLDKLIYTEGNGFSELDADLQTMYRRAHELARDDWALFKNNPKFLHEELLSS